MLKDETALQEGSLLANYTYSPNAPATKNITTVVV
jgi:hypothetical protein